MVMSHFSEKVTRVWVEAMEANWDSGLGKGECLERDTLKITLRILFIILIK